MSRQARVERSTKESEVLVEVELDGTGVSSIETGVPFFDHIVSFFVFFGIIFYLILNVPGSHQRDQPYTPARCAVLCHVPPPKKHTSAAHMHD